MKTKKLVKRLEKLAKELGADGYVRVDSIEFLMNGDGNFVVSGAYGVQNTDGKVVFQKEFEIFSSKNDSLDFIAGRLYEQMQTEDADK